MSPIVTHHHVPYYHLPSLPLISLTITLLSLIIMSPTITHHHIPYYHSPSKPYYHSPSYPLLSLIVTCPTISLFAHWKSEKSHFYYLHNVKLTLGPFWQDSPLKLMERSILTVIFDPLPVSWDPPFHWIKVAPGWVLSNSGRIPGGVGGVC